MTAFVFICIALGATGITGWAVLRSPGFRIWLSGALFISSGVQLYFWAVGLPVPIAGTALIQTPRLSLARGLAHACLFFIVTSMVALNRQAKTETSAPVDAIDVTPETIMTASPAERPG